MKLSENTSINIYAIELVKSNTLYYKSIYGLKYIKLKTLTTYNKKYPKTRFINDSKFFIVIFIFFNKKLNNNLCLYVNYKVSITILMEIDIF